MGNDTAVTQIAVTRTAKSRLSEELRENSPFGTNYSDHMFVADWKDGEWSEPRVVPFGEMTLSPATTALQQVPASAGFSLPGSARFA